MENKKNKADDLFNLMTKIGQLYSKRTESAQQAFTEAIQKAAADSKPSTEGPFENPWQALASYMIDAAQRAVLFSDILHERGKNYVERVKEGSPPLLAFQWEMIMDGRTFDRPVNYALIRILPPEGVSVDNNKRPFVIVDPRAGHGPGIGGSKKDSEVGMALQFGHPVYFVIFFPDPEPGQTIMDVSAAETRFLEAVINRHPKSSKPVLYGNCQGGWASMMVAANDPGKVGVVVINGSPMSYWSGNFGGGEGENPMRYSGGLLGGSWSALLSSDLGNGKFDGAHLVQNFENLNPANTFWNKYYNVWKNVDTERERFLEFEKWWGSFFLMNEDEIRWIVNNLFVGNKLARGEVKAAPGSYIDLKAIRSPIVIFSSKGDNITPPQQAMNWVSDVYSSTAEIKANGQVIVGLVQEDVGHLGIFVSGKVAQKEHMEIVEAIDYIERLRPGLYVMELTETQGKGKDKYLSTFREVKLEDMRKMNRLERRDEKPFELVAEISQMNEKAYAIFGRPLVKGIVNEQTAEIGRKFHPLRMQRWLFSDYNPTMWPLSSMASYVHKERKPVEKTNPWLRFERMYSEMITASLNLYRDLRDAASEAAFFQIYGAMITLGAAGDVKLGEPVEAQTDPRTLPFVKEALAQIEKGGYPEALARIGALLGRFAGQIPLERLAMTDELIKSDKILSKISENESKRLRSEAGVMVLMEPERTFRALPLLLSKTENRDRVLQLMERALSLEGITKEQNDMGNRIVALLKGESTGSGKRKKAD